MQTRFGIEYNYNCIFRKKNKISVKKIQQIAFCYLKNLTFGANTNLTAMRWSVTSHFSVNFRDKTSTCVFDFQRKIIIALLIEFIFYTSNAYCRLKI